jgi:4-amino-4-deoxy-L-arabinose transferase-like glycosyltransferase
MSSSRWYTSLAAGAVAALCAALLLATSWPLAMVWDEGDTIVRAERLTSVARSSGADGRPAMSTTLRGESNWPYTTVREGHPPLAGIVIAVGRLLAPSALEPLTRARFGPIVLFSLATGAMFYRLVRDYRMPAVGIMAVVALLTMPRVFAHAHYATLDGPLTACWVLAWAAFAPACRDWRLAPLFGLALGLTLCAKFTGWLAVIPFVVWAAMYRDRGAMRALVLGVPIAVGLFVLLNPPLWDRPLGGIWTFFELNLSRAVRPGHNITTQFFGHMYDLDHPLPWYNALVWTAITVTPIVVLIGVLGIVSSMRRWRNDRASGLLVCSWATLIVVRALPIAPPHDAERLILPSFAFFAALVGVGIGRALYRDTLLLPERIPAQGWAKVAMGLAIAGATFDTVSYFPHNLSFYSRAIGGLRGATACGMEPTYYWDSLDHRTLEWLNEHTADDEQVVFGSSPRHNLELLRRWGLLKPLPTPLGRNRWYVLQRRPSALNPVDQALIEHDQPAFQRTLSGVPLLDVYPYDRYREVLSAAIGSDQ